MNFEQLKLQMHMRQLYERLGSQTAELMIVDAFLKEQARHDKLLEQRALGHKNSSVETPNNCF